MKRLEVELLKAQSSSEGSEASSGVERKSFRMKDLMQPYRSGEDIGLFLVNFERTAAELAEDFASRRALDRREIPQREGQIKKATGWKGHSVQDNRELNAEPAEKREKNLAYGEGVVCALTRSKARELATRAAPLDVSPRITEKAGVEEPANAVDTVTTPASFRSVFLRREGMGGHGAGASTGKAAEPSWRHFGFRSAGNRCKGRGGGRVGAT
ncbi:hypothetical protein HPB52_010730 [Rhipicephalus sanguineus]|uniref:Uncharacterized protein n=1 Tax=Rhipicephalus sanguineus TaxID=34632 RepID=A0A9D4T9F1_RHISA|nr:hypothetical protein HPB52_010730 [Rhipicephalus sanguineus]